jgi:O-antigen/teichoic acid export membrane protein
LASRAAAFDVVAQPAARNLNVLKTALTTAHRWKGRIFYAIVDQGAGSAANFLATILYAAWLPLDSFGHYVLLWTISLFIENLQIALMIDGLPALVSRFGRSNRQRIDAAGAWVALGFGGATSLLLLAAVPFVAWWTPEFVIPVLCLAAINPIQRLYIYVRRLCYIRDRQNAAAAGALVYCVTILCGTFGLHQLDALSLTSILLLWGAGVAIATLAMGLMGVPWLSAARPTNVAWLALNLLRSGRWLVGAAVCLWIAQWGVFPLAATISGPDAVGVLRALQTLFTPIVQFNAAAYLALLPRVADNVAARGRPYARSFASYGAIAFSGIMVVYCGLVLLEAPRIVAFAFRKPEIIASTNLLWPLAAGIVLQGAGQGPAMALLAEGRNQVLFVSRVAAVLAFFVVAAVLGPLMGVEGLLWANAVAHGLATAWLMAATLAQESQSMKSSRLSKTDALLKPT